jgi:PAS domain S-box-containing protein
MALAAAGPDGAADKLAETIDEVSEQLLVADEELRVQNENLAQAAHRLDLMVAAHEELFAYSPTAYVQTDADGLVVRFNHAARRLLAVPEASQRSLTISGLVHADDRTAVRALLTALRTGPGASETKQTQPLEATVVRPDGTAVPVVVNVRRSSDDGSDRSLLHWELQEQGTQASDQPDSARPRTQWLNYSGVQALADAAAQLAQQETPALTVENVVQLAKDAIPGCDEAGITLMHGRERVESPAATGPLAAQCDQLQHEIAEGPCLAAIKDGEPITVTDVAADPRWPKFGPRAAELGVGSVLALPLPASRGTLGALNLYSREVGGFGADAAVIGAAFATHAAIALAHAELEANLRLGLRTREEIGRAVGIVMARNRISATESFDLLVYASQHAHLKLREVAAWVNETGDDPANLVHAARKPRPPH